MPSSPGRPRVRGATARTGTASVRAVNHLIALGVAAGIRRGILIGAAGATEDDLRNPDARLPLAAEIALWQTLAINIPDPEFGVRAGQAYRLRQAGLIGYIVRFSSTLQGALLRLERYGRVFTEAVEFRLQERHPEVALTRAHPTLGPGGPLAESHRLAVVLQASREMTGVDVVPVKVNFTYDEPSTVAAHRRHFRCPLHFGARTASIVFRRSDLDLTIAGGDETLADYLSNYAEQVLSSLVRGDTVRQRVHASIWSLLADGAPTLAQVAAALRWSPRTLQRHLAAEGTSLQAEVEAIRKRMALAALRDRSTPIDDVSFLLGYAEPSTFYRAFKRWTGTTPRRFRAA